MDKKQLLQYSDLLKERDKLASRIEKLDKQTEIVSDVVQNGYKRHAIIYGVDITRVDKLKELRAILAVREAEIIRQQIEIEKYISNIKESSVRQLFEYRYIENNDWYQIAIKMGYKEESVPRKRVERYLKNN